MTADLSARPELLMGPNPIIEAGPPFVPVSALPEALASYPLEGKRYKHLPPEAREPLLEFAPMHFAPTSVLVEAATGIQRLIRRSAILRNPLMEAERRRSNELAMAESAQMAKRVAFLDGAGGLIDGMTAAGKTALIKRCMTIFAPSQIIEHGPCKQAGWHKMVQCVYLHVDFPSNGTRGALLKRVLLAIDEALGTSYFDDYARVVNLDTLLTVVCKLLSNHRVALLVIDEKQERTFNASPWQLEFALFYLSVMNLGTSVLLVGNPLAFQNFGEYSQLMRRFSLGGVHHLVPASSIEEPWWKRDFVPRLRKFDLVDRICVTDDARAKHEYIASGGLSGLLATYHTEVQRVALRRGGTSAELRDCDYLEALTSPAYIQVLRVAQELTAPSGHYSDIPPGYREHKQASDDPLSTEAAVGSGDAPVSQPVDVIKTLVSRYRAERTRDDRKFLERLASVQGLAQEDLRMLGISSETIRVAAKALPNQTRSLRRRRP